MRSFNEQKILNLGQALDALMTVDLHARGVIKPIYEAMEAKIGEPLSTHAARMLLASMKNREDPVVLIGTGFLVKPTLHPETDGPISSALLARAVSLLGGLPIIISQANSMCVLEAACRAAELIPVRDCEKLAETPHSVALLAMPPCSQKREADQLTQTLMALGPVAAITIELPGKAANGKYHSTLGYELEYWPGPIDDLLDLVGKAGGCTIGIGDAGNEAGMGIVEHALDTLIPYGSLVGTVGGCKAPLIASISEYGAYALIAAMEFISEKKILHSPELVEAVLRAAVSAGGLDGCTGKPVAAMDMVEVEYIRAYVSMLHCAIATTNRFAPSRPFFIDFCRGETIGEPGTYSGGHGKSR